jgi:hypothetical protein
VKVALTEGKNLSKFNSVIVKRVSTLPAWLRFKACDSYKDSKQLECCDVNLVRFLPTLFGVRFVQDLDIS